MTDTIAPAIAAFAADVRAALADLPPEEVDDLTDGLEADLAERLEDAPDADLGDPAEYAAELRAAAGYPAGPGVRKRWDPIAELRQEIRDLREAMAALAARHRVVGGTIAMLAALRPAWWVFRGWLLYLLVATVLLGGPMIPTDAFKWTVLVLSVVVSVQLGRRAWVRNEGFHAALRVIDVVLLIATPAVLTALVSSFQATSYVATWYPGQLNIDGRTIENIFVYDEHGQLIERAQLFDQHGEPLDLVTGGADWVPTSNGTVVVPSDDTPGRPGWNVYPLREAEEMYLDDGTVEGEPHEAKPPFLEVRPLSGVTPEPEATTPPE